MSTVQYGATIALLLSIRASQEEGVFGFILGCASTAAYAVSLYCLVYGVR